MITRSRRGPRSLNVLAVAAALLLAVAAAGCGSSSGSSSDDGSSTTAAHTASESSNGLPTFKIIGTMPYGYSFPKATAPSGYVRVEFVNQDQTMAHQAQLEELRPGVTLEKLKADLASPVGEGALMMDGTPAGGPNAIGPGQSDTAVVKLTPGTTYAVLCSIPAPDGKPHYAHGMISSFTVSNKPGVEKAPPADSTIKLVDFGFQGADAADWSAPIKVVNEGTQPHELAILGPAPGKTLADVEAALKAPPGSTPPGPPPYRVYGGVAAIAPGTSQVFQTSLPAGSYDLVCFVGDANPPHLPHFMEGMLTQFTVK